MYVRWEYDIRSSWGGSMSTSGSLNGCRDLCTHINCTMQFILFFMPDEGIHCGSEIMFFLWHDSIEFWTYGSWFAGEIFICLHCYVTSAKRLWLRTQRYGLSWYGVFMCGSMDYVHVLFLDTCCTQTLALCANTVINWQLLFSFILGHLYVQCRSRGQIT